MDLEKYEELMQLVREAREQHEQVFRGKKVAAVRARKILQKIKRLAQECRVQIQSVKKSGEEPEKGGTPSPPSATPPPAV